jgi:hypothetical protein
MLQLAENKRERHAQIAKKSKNGFPPSCPFPASPAVPRTAAVNTSTAAQIGVLCASMLPCCQRYQRAMLGIDCARVGKR